VRRLVVDTNVYVDWMNAGRHEDVLFEKGAVKYLSAVVLMELRGVFAEAGEALRRLQSEKGYNLASTPSLVGDVLIALSARAIGAVVITQNERDFRAIQSVRPFSLEIVAAA
jgi:predicted nucleic acid-binding protein